MANTLLERFGRLADTITEKTIIRKNAPTAIICIIDTDCAAYCEATEGRTGKCVAGRCVCMG
ncbi:hypothetical protein ABZX75_33335 [Streptomyces sp. NPDC003038]|uniref:hypothetical protein n=1 Tax=unclassified Streptomyces TaxID=2593676 RepID=UPI0033B22E0B